MSYVSERLVSDDGPSSVGSTEDPAWRSIRQFSILMFSRKVMRLLGVDEDSRDGRQFWRELANSALRDGEDVRWRGVTYTPAMQLELYQRREEFVG